MKKLTIEKLATSLVNEFHWANTALCYMWRLKFCLPENSDSEKIAEYINHNFSQYESHPKNNILVAEKLFPTLSIGLAQELVFEGNKQETPQDLAVLCGNLIAEYKWAKSLPYFCSIQLSIPSWTTASDVANCITNHYDHIAYVKRLNTIVICNE